VTEGGRRRRATDGGRVGGRVEGGLAKEGAEEPVQEEGLSPWGGGSLRRGSQERSAEVEGEFGEASACAPLASASFGQMP